MATRDVNRAAAVAIVALALVIPAPSAAQRRDRTETEAFLIFLQSLATQSIARLCERSVEGYRQRFDDVYARWSARHRTRIARGEAFFREAVNEKDRSSVDPAKVQQIEQEITQLAQPPRDTSPITLNDRMRAECERNLTDLEAARRAQPE